MNLARTRAFAAAVGAACLAVAALSLIEIGGPDASRQARRDGIRLERIREIARALRCHEQAAETRPTRIEEIAAACLAPDRAAELTDPADGAAYRIERPAPGIVRVCAPFEAAARIRFYDAPDAPFDRATGCVTAMVAP